MFGLGASRMYFGATGCICFIRNKNRISVLMLSDNCSYSLEGNKKSTPINSGAFLRVLQSFVSFVSTKYGAGSRSRTYEGVCRQIYSLMRLTTSLSQRYDYFSKVFLKNKEKSPHCCGLALRLRFFVSRLDSRGRSGFRELY